jgi:predicted Ser/Thr protein kinase
MEELTKHCPYCDEVIRANAVKCKHCASMLTDLPPVAGTDPRSTVKLALAGRYDVQSEIGSGGNATVYQAVQVSLQRTVALKVLLPQLTSDKEYLERFHHEARAIAQLQHPNIVTIHDEGAERGVHFMAMEFLEGVDLHRLIAEQTRLSWIEAIDILSQVASALDYAHQRGLIHRDVKSGNIIITNPGRAVLTDFGLAYSRTAENLTQCGVIMGTPEFMSPEQADGKPVDTRTDIYSLGVVLYHMLTGTYPHRGDSPLATIYKIVHEPYTPVSELVDLPPWVEELADRCLAKNPADRFQRASQILQACAENGVAPAGSLDTAPRTIQIDPEQLRDLERYNEPAPRTPARAVARTRPPGRLNPRRAAVLVGLITMGLIVLGYVLLEYPSRMRAAATPKVTVRNESTVPPPTAMQFYTRVTVPDLYGLTALEAREMLSRRGLALGAVLKGTAAPDYLDRVFKQIPEPGAEVDPGKPVTVHIGVLGE